MNIVDCNLGFDGRKFLTEWRTYLRRKPVRYVHKAKTRVCEICSLPGTRENPLQNAHRIGFDCGVRNLALTPEYLDDHTNIVTAHRIKCNNLVELSLEDTIQFLQDAGVREIPQFLPEWIHVIWYFASKN